jgi:hypothetical protein
MSEITQNIETTTSTKTTFTATAADTSLITAVVAENLASISYAGANLTIPVSDLMALAALVTTVAANNPVTISEVSSPDSGEDEGSTTPDSGDDSGAPATTPDSGAPDSGADSGTI